MSHTANIIKTTVADKEALIKLMLGHVEESARAAKGLEAASASVLSNESAANTRKMLNTTMKLLRRQQELNQALISVVVLLCSSRDFTGWQAELAMKLGSDPQEILRQMMREKMAGR